jgi:hypothetical protein
MSNPLISNAKIQMSNQCQISNVKTPPYPDSDILDIRGFEIHPPHFIGGLI